MAAMKRYRLVIHQGEMCTKSGSFLPDAIVFTEQLSTQENTSWVLKTIYSWAGLLPPGCILTAEILVYTISCHLMYLALWKEPGAQRLISPP